jgi:hypothetical protein
LSLIDLKKLSWLTVLFLFQSEFRNPQSQIEGLVAGN